MDAPGELLRMLTGWRFQIWWLLLQQRKRRKRLAAASEAPGSPDGVVGEDGGAMLGEDGGEILGE